MRKILLIYFLLIFTTAYGQNGRFGSDTGDGTHNAVEIRGKPITLIAPADNQILKYDSSSDSLLFEADATGAGSGAFSDAADPVVLNTTTKDVHVGDGAGTLAGKFEIGGDADQPQLVIEQHSTQTDDPLIVQLDNDTEQFSISPSPSIFLREVADAAADKAAYGQFWVNTATPNEAYFTTDAGNDRELVYSGGASHDSFSDFVAGEHIVEGTIDHGSIAGLADDDHSAYENELNNSAGLLAALSDETGTMLSVFSDAPTFTTNITVPTVIAGLLDPAGAVDLDLGSADVTDVRIETDGGVVVIDGNITQDAGTILFAGGLIDATGAVDMDYGSGDITDHTFIADGTTDADFVVPLTSISGAEMVSGTVNSTQLADAAVTRDKLGFHVIEKTIVYPDTMLSAGPDTLWVGRNHWGVAVTVDSVQLEADTDNYDMSIVKSNQDGSGGALVDAVQAITNGANHFYITETTITSASIPVSGRIGLALSSDNADQTTVRIYLSW